MDISLLFPILVLLLFIPLFLSSRKQKRAQAADASAAASLEPGDVVSTTSGLRGTVVDASYEDTVDLEIADGVVTTWVRARDPREDRHRRARRTTPSRAAVVDEPAAPSLEKAPVRPEQPSLVQDGAAAALEKDDSTNGSPRS